MNDEDTKLKIDFFLSIDSFGSREKKPAVFETQIETTPIKITPIEI